MTRYNQTTTTDNGLTCACTFLFSPSPRPSLLSTIVADPHLNFFIVTFRRPNHLPTPAMAFLFQTPIKHPTHPSEPANTTTSQAEYEHLIFRENGISHTQKQRLDNQNLAPVGKGVGLSGTAINTIKCSVGAGILTFPYAFQLAGWLGGTIAFTCITLPVLYCLQRIGAVRTMLL